MKVNAAISQLELFLEPRIVWHYRPQSNRRPLFNQGILFYVETLCQKRQPLLLPPPLLIIGRSELSQARRRTAIKESQHSWERFLQAAFAALKRVGALELESPKKEKLHD